MTDRPLLTKPIEVYTDGSLRKTAKGTLCGYGIYFPNKELKNVSAPFTQTPITNNRAELYAIYQAIVKIDNRYKFNHINIYTDSEYSQKALTVWVSGWKKNNWHNSKKEPVENQDIIKKIDRYMIKYKNKITIKWIRAHTNKNDMHSIGNAKADELAKKGAELSIN